MNKLLFTLSLVVLVAVTTYSQKIIKEYIREASIVNLFHQCENKIDTTQVNSTIDTTLQCLEIVTEGPFSDMSDELQKNETERKLRIVFKDFCNNNDAIITCVKPVYNLVEPCFDENELRMVNFSSKIFNGLLEYACYNDGEKIRRYFNEKPKECLAEQHDNLNECFQNFAESIQKYYNKNTTLLNYDIMNTKMFCEDFNSVQMCSIKQLRKCKDQIPARTADDIFKIILNATECDTISSGSSYGNFYISKFLFGIIILSIIIKLKIF